jgi:hypothetical protein
MAVSLELRSNRASRRALNDGAEEAGGVEEEVLLDQKTDTSILAAEDEAGATLSMGVGAVEVIEKARAIEEDMLQRKARRR